MLTARSKILHNKRSINTFNNRIKNNGLLIIINVINFRQNSFAITNNLHKT